MMADTERPPVAQMGADSRHRGREVALQMLYQWEVGRVPIDEVCRTFWTGGPAGTPPAPRGRLDALFWQLDRRRTFGFVLFAVPCYAHTEISTENRGARRDHRRRHHRA